MPKKAAQSAGVGTGTVAAAKSVVFGCSQWTHRKERLVGRGTRLECTGITNGLHLHDFGDDVCACTAKSSRAVPRKS